MSLLSRRESFAAFGGALVAACQAPAPPGPAPAWVPPRAPQGERDTSALSFEDNVDAAFEVLLPADRDAEGRVTVPGAREAGAGRVLAEEGFGLYALAQGFVPALPDRIVRLLESAGDAFRAAVNADLDALASLRRPLVAFRDLPASMREAIVAEAFDDPDRRGAMLVLRAAAFTAYLGAATSDVGLRAVGFPPFEDFAGGVAVSGYPRTKAGRLVDATKEDLAALAAAGELDDYTYDRAPDATTGDDLTKVLTPDGDLG